LRVVYDIKRWKIFERDNEQKERGRKWKVKDRRDNEQQTMRIMKDNRPKKEERQWKEQYSNRDITKETIKEQQNEGGITKHG